MKRLNGTIVQQVVQVKSIAIMVLVWITFLSVSCNEKSTTAKTDVGGKGREIVYLAPASVYVLADVGGGKNDSTIRKNQDLVVLDVGGKNQNVKKNSLFENNVVALICSSEVGGRSSAGTIQIASLGDHLEGGKTLRTADSEVGGKNTSSTGNFYLVFFCSDDVGGKDIKNLKRLPSKAEFS